MRVGEWSIAILFLVACGPAVLQLPSKGMAWTEIQSEHFTLWTDATPERGRDLLRRMERYRQVIATAMNRAETQDRAFVIALRGEFEVDIYVEPGIVAKAWGGSNPSGQRGILLNANDHGVGRVANHELAHVISFGILRNQPPWLTEGLATYFETVDFSPDQNFVKVGLAPEAASYLPATLLRVADVVECRRNCTDDPRFYGSSWALFTYLINERFDQLSRYLQRINELPRDRQGDVWREVFADLTFEQLDHTLPAWLRIGEVALPRIKVSVQDLSATVRRLSDADVLAARSLLAILFEKRTEAVDADLKAALALDRTNVLARLITTVRTDAISPDDARATAAAHPDDWRAWWLVVRAVDEGPEEASALARMCTLNPRFDDCDRDGDSSAN